MKKTLAFFALLFAVLVVLSAPILAQTAPADGITIKATWKAVTIDETNLSTIVVLANSVVACALMAFASKKWKLSSLGVYGISFVICLASTGIYLGYLCITNSTAWSWAAFVAYGGAVYAATVVGDLALVKAGAITTS